MVRLVGEITIVMQHTHVVLNIRIASREENLSACLIVTVLACQMKRGESSVVANVECSPRGQYCYTSAVTLPSGFVECRITVLKQMK
jgi:hypothetical protein